MNAIKNALVGVVVASVLVLVWAFFIGNWLTSIPEEVIASPTPVPTATSVSPIGSIVPAGNGFIQGETRVRITGLGEKPSNRMMGPILGLIIIGLGIAIGLVIWIPQSSKGES